MFGVFVHREDSRYNDEPLKSYQFPKSYFSRAAQFEGGWVLYYEPTKVPRSRGYSAAAKIEKIIPDPVEHEMFIALIEPGSYFELPSPVPFKDAGGLLERGLQDFDMPLPRDGVSDKSSDDETGNTAREDQGIFQDPDLRKRQAYQGNRLIRDPMFRRLILNAYDERCAFTGPKFINGGGRAEVQAAHIRPNISALDSRLGL